MCILFKINVLKKTFAQIQRLCVCECVAVWVVGWVCMCVCVWERKIESTKIANIQSKCNFWDEKGNGCQDWISLLLLRKKAAAGFEANFQLKLLALMFRLCGQDPEIPTDAVTCGCSAAVAKLLRWWVWFPPGPGLFSSLSIPQLCVLNQVLRGRETLLIFRDKNGCLAVKKWCCHLKANWLC